MERYNKRITKSQAKEFYRDLCDTVYGDSNINANGIMSVEHIADLMNLPIETANKFCSALLSYGITERSCGMIIV